MNSSFTVAISFYLEKTHYENLYFQSLLFFTSTFIFLTLNFKYFIIISNMRDSYLNKPQTKFQSWGRGIWKTEFLSSRLEEGWSYFQRILTTQSTYPDYLFCEASSMNVLTALKEKMLHSISSTGEGKEFKFFNKPMVHIFTWNYINSSSLAWINVGERDSI